MVKFSCLEISLPPLSLLLLLVPKFNRPLELMNCSVCRQLRRAKRGAFLMKDERNEPSEPNELSGIMLVW